MLIVPPLVDMVAIDPVADVIVRGKAAVVLLWIETAPPDVVICELAPRFTNGAYTFKLLPPVILSVVPLAKFIASAGITGADPESSLTSTSPFGPALNV